MLSANYPVIIIIHVYNFINEGRRPKRQSMADLNLGTCVVYDCDGEFVLFIFFSFITIQHH